MPYIVNNEIRTTEDETRVLPNKVRATWGDKYSVKAVIPLIESGVVPAKLVLTKVGNGDRNLKLVLVKTGAGMTGNELYRIFT